MGEMLAKAFLDTCEIHGIPRDNLHDLSRPREKDEGDWLTAVYVYRWQELYSKQAMQTKAYLRHLVLELCYDISQVAVMAWVDAQVTLKKKKDWNGKLLLDFLNWIS